MHVGILTAPFRKKPLEEVIRWAGENSIRSLEVLAGPGCHIDPEKGLAGDGKALKKALGEAGVSISSLAYYFNPLGADDAERAKQMETVKSAVLACEKLGVGVLCTMAGMPVPGKSKMETIEQFCPAHYGEICSFAADHGVKIAIENWYATNFQHLDHWKRMFELVPAENFGLNFDPSHLYWQGIDHIAAVEEFAERIFHTHAKDCRIMQHRLRRVGCLEGGWWSYVIPGYGGIHWGEYISALKQTGYDDVLSIEHEDPWLGVEEGFLKGRDHLEQFC